MKTLIFLIAGLIVWFILLSFMPTSENMPIQYLYQQIFLLFGFVVGYFAKAKISERPWMALFLPLIPFVAGVFGLI
jgi:hypothetical protein